MPPTPAGRAVLAVALALVTPSIGAGAETRRGGSLCSPSEPVLFTCRIGAKTVSICGRSPDGRAGAVYSYGRPGRVELEASDLHRASRAFSGAGETQVYADTDTNRYVVYDRMTRAGVDPQGHNLPEATQGLLVRSGARTISDRSCALSSDADPPSFDQRRITALLPEGAYVPH